MAKGFDVTGRPNRLRELDLDRFFRPKISEFFEFRFDRTANCIFEIRFLNAGLPGNDLRVYLVDDLS